MNKRRLLLLMLILLGVPALLAGKNLWRPVTAMECTLTDRGVFPEGESPFPAVAENDWVQGPDDALVTLIVYLDYQCPHCEVLAPMLDQLQTDYPEDLRLVIRHLPLETLHDKARLAAQATEAAGLQGQFWPMHDRLFERQADWMDLSKTAFEKWLRAQAQELNLDDKQFAHDLTDSETTAMVEGSYQEATSIGLNGTPTLVINGQYYEGVKDHWTLAALIELIKLEQRRFHECPPMEINPRKQYTATLHTTQGDIVMALRPEQAPLAVNSFVFLARQNWYDGVPFHRVIPEFLAQTGDPSGTGLGGPGYTFVDEIVPEAKFDQVGTVGMANSGPNSNGSQFFITLAAQEALDSKHTIFGEVLAGMEVAEKLTVRDPATDSANLPPADQILSVTIEESSK